MVEDLAASYGFAGASCTRSVGPRDLGASRLRSSPTARGRGRSARRRLRRRARRDRRAWRLGRARDSRGRALVLEVSPHARANSSGGFARGARSCDFRAGAVVSLALGLNLLARTDVYAGTSSLARHGNPADQPPLRLVEGVQPNSFTSTARPSRGAVAGPRDRPAHVAALGTGRVGHDGCRRRARVRPSSRRASRCPRVRSSRVRRVARSRDRKSLPRRPPARARHVGPPRPGVLEGSRFDGTAASTCWLPVSASRRTAHALLIAPAQVHECRRRPRRTTTEQDWLPTPRGAGALARAMASLRWTTSASSLIRSRARVAAGFDARGARPVCGCCAAERAPGHTCLPTTVHLPWAKLTGFARPDVDLANVCVDAARALSGRSARPSVAPRAARYVGDAYTPGSPT